MSLRAWATAEEARVKERLLEAVAERRSLRKGSAAAGRAPNYLAQIRSGNIQHLRLDRVLEALAAVDEDPGAFFRSCWPESRGNLPPEAMRKALTVIEQIAEEGQEKTTKTKRGRKGKGSP